MKNPPITISAPGKIHLLGEHAVVYGKPSLLTTVNLRVTVKLFSTSSVIPSEARNLPSSEDHSHASSSTSRSKFIVQNDIIKKFQSIIEPIIKKHLKIKTIPPYQLSISSQMPIGSGLGSSAAISASYIAALLLFLKQRWDLNLINELTLKAEKVFHGNPSGADNAAVIYGGLLSFTKGLPLQVHSFPIPGKIVQNFILINTGRPKETTKEMVEMVSSKFKVPILSSSDKVENARFYRQTHDKVGVQSLKFKKIFDEQGKLTKKLLEVIQKGDEKELISIIRAGERNLEKIGVVSSFVKSIIRKIEKAGGAAKICGGGGKIGPTGVLLCYHPNQKIVKNIAKEYNLNYIKTNLGVEGIKQDSRNVARSLNIM